MRLHVAAKRYLRAVDPRYRAALSAASAQSLQLQGGPFDAAEILEFEGGPFFFDAVRLRRYDDIAKQPGAWTPELEHYRGAGKDRPYRSISTHTNGKASVELIIRRRYICTCVRRQARDDRVGWRCGTGSRLS